MQKLVDIYIVYQFVKRLTTPFEKTPAFRLGIIDKQGNVLRPVSTLKTSEEKNAWTWFDILINNLKRLLAKIPGGTNRLFTYLAAFWLLKEPIAKLREAATWDEALLSEAVLGPDSQQYLTEAQRIVDEDAPAMATGHGAIAGLGVGPQGEPGVKLPRKRKRPSKVRPIQEPNLKEEKFAGYEVFDVDSDTFQRCRLGKRKQQHYKTYVGTGPVGETIRQYGRKHGRKGIILRDQTTGVMMFLRRPGLYGPEK